MHRLENSLAQACRGLINHQQSLLTRRAPAEGDRRYQTSSHGQLLGPGGRDSVAAGCRDDARIGRALRKPRHSVTEQ